jgi:hypothetical protein
VKTISTTGTISIRRVAADSKSDQVTVVLTTPDHAWLLRRTGQQPFGVDPDLAELDGKRVAVTGYAGGGVFLLTEDPVALD